MRIGQLLFKKNKWSDNQAWRDNQRNGKYTLSFPREDFGRGSALFARAIGDEVSSAPVNPNPVRDGAVVGTRTIRCPCA